MRVLKKYENNPIFSPKDMPIDVLYTFNPGVIKTDDEYVMIMDFTGLDDIHRLWVARSKDGYNFTPDPNPVKMPEEDPFHKEVYCYDPRITKFGDDYIILFASDSGNNYARLGIMKTRNFIDFERISTGSELGNRNGVLFPEKYNDLYFRLDRPFGNELDPCSIWMSFSPDLVFWGQSRPLMYKGKPFIQEFKMGAGSVPIKTDKGWLEIYHTVANTCNGFIYRLNACLLDIDSPWNVIGYTDFILWPEYDYEMQGRVGNVVFTCNAVPEPDGSLKIYYGAADRCIGLAEGKLNELVDLCLKDRK